MIEQIQYKDLPRCPLPVIFLDTHIISNMAKWKMSKKLDEVTLERTKTLYERIYELVTVKKMICPELLASQDEYRLDSRIEEVCEKLVVHLSQGITFRDLQGVEDLQIPLAMKAYVQDAGPVDYSKEWFSMYYSDPIEQLLDDTPFIIRSDLAKKMFDNAQIRRGKKALQIELTDIKKEDAHRTPSFDEKLEEEYTGYMKGILQLGSKPDRKLLKGEDVTFEDMMDSITLGMHLTYWEELGGKPESMKGLIEFYRSEYLRSVPCVEMRCKLWAGLAVYLKSAKPRESDPNDVRILASVMPYADYLVLDKTMVDLARDRLHLAEKYNTKIYALSDIDMLLTELEEIGKRESPLLSICQH